MVPSMIFIWTLKNLRETEAEAMVKKLLDQVCHCKSIYSSGAKVFKNTHNIKDIILKKNKKINS